MWALRGSENSATFLYLFALQKQTHVLGSSIPVLGKDVKQGESVIGLFFKINLLKKVSMESSQQDLFHRLLKYLS